MSSSSPKKSILDKDLVSTRRDMERSIISMLLRSKMAVVRNIHRLDVDMFSDETCKIIFGTIKRYRKKVGLELFINDIKKRKKKIFGKGADNIKKRIEKLERVFVKLSARKVSTDKIEPLIDEVVKYARTDRMAQVMFKYIGLVEDGEIDEAEKYISQEVFNVKRESGNVIVDKAEVTEYLNERIEEAQKISDDPDYIKRSYTGIKGIDKATGGLWPGELGIIEGGSSIGKSTLLMEFAHYRRLLGGKALFITIEMPRDQVEKRYDARVGGLNYMQKLKHGGISDKEIKRLKKKMKATGKRGGKIYVASVPQGCTPAVVEQILEEYKMNGIDIDTLFIDYLDLMELDHKVWSEQHLLGQLSKQLKGIARAWQLGLWTPTQASAEGLDEDSVSESSIGYSRRKFQNADIFIEVLLTQRDLEEGTITVQIVKARDGMRNQFIRLRPQFDKMRIKEI